MKKLLTIVLALSMVFALAIPALAEGEEAVVKTVGWDEIVADATETVYNEFQLTVTRLEYYPVSNITANGWQGDYYVEYDPDNKGVVDGSPIRFFVNFTLPTTADLTAAQLNEYNQSGSVKLTVTPSNFTFTTIVGGTKLNKTGKTFEMQKYLMDNINSKGNFVKTYTLDKTYTQTCQYMITGTVNSTADATATAKLSYGMSGFDADGNFYFTVGGVEYKVNHTGNYFYVENVDDKLDYVVRFTVNSANKITDIAVNAGENHTSEYKDVKVVKTYKDGATAANLADAVKVMADYRKALDITNLEMFFDYYLDAIDDDLIIQSEDLTAIKAIRDKIETTYPTNASYDAVKALVDNVINASAHKYAYNSSLITVAAITKDMDDNGDLLDVYQWVTVNTPDEYNYDVNGNEAYVRNWEKAIDLAYVVDASAEHNDNFYTASKIVDSSAIVFSLDKYKDVVKGYKVVANGDVVPGGAKIDNPTNTAATAQLKDALGADLPTWIQVTNTYNTEKKDVMTSGTTYNKYLAALNEILDVLDYNWDGSTKYMQEEHFLNMFSNAYASNVSVTWKAYTATLIVEPEVDPPQTGDASTIVGFVMLAMAIAAAAVVTIKKVRA